MLVEKVENVIVTGASGGVGSIAVMILNKLGCNVTAVTGKDSNKEYLKSIGAKNIINSSELNKEPRPLDKGLWDGAVDTVGGQILANVLAQMKEGGIVAACGNAADIKLNTTVMPFIIRGVKLWGINSVNASIKRRQFLWNEVAKLVDFDLLGQSIKDINLDGLLEVERKEDAGNGLYEVFNKVQESLVKGKYLYASSGKVNAEGTKTRKGREIKNFKQSIDVNKKLSELAFALV